MLVKRISMFILCCLFLFGLAVNTFAIIMGNNVVATKSSVQCYLSDNPSGTVNLSVWMFIMGVQGVSVLTVYTVLWFCGYMYNSHKCMLLSRFISVLELMWISAWSSLCLISFLHSYEECKESTNKNDHGVWIGTYILLLAQIPNLIMTAIMAGIPASWIVRVDEYAAYRII